MYKTKSSPKNINMKSPTLHNLHCHHTRLHITINTRIGVPFALPHRIALSHHCHVDVVNRTAPSPRPISPSSRRAASSSQIPPHCWLVHSLSIPDGRSGAGVTLHRPACEPTWHRSHFPPGLPGSASETFATRGGGGQEGLSFETK